MKKTFSEYGGVIVTVIAIVALITLVTFLMQPGGVQNGAFSNIVQSFVDKSHELVDGSGTGDEIGSAVHPVFENGSYFENGFVDSNTRIRAELSEGKYYIESSDSVYYAIYYYSSDTEGTRYLSMSSQPDREVTLTGRAYITMQKTDGSIMSPSDGNILSITQLPDNENEQNDVTEYYVGTSKQYNTINEALTAWSSDGYPTAVVYVENGTYCEVVTVDSQNISFIGESRDGVIVKTTTGAYTDSPFHIRHGNVTVCNMTIIAEHGEDFNYEEQPIMPTCAYGMHIDGGTLAGKVIVKDCKIISYQSPALGMGTIPNSTIRIENCELYSYTDYTDDTTSKQYRCLGYGALLCHMSSPENYENRGIERLELVNTTAYMDNYPVVIKLNHGSDLTESMSVLAINTNLESGASENTNLYVSAAQSLIDLDTNSIGNNCEALNN